MDYKVICIVKVGDKKFVKYRVSNLLKFTAFIDRCYVNWRWYNVYDNDSGCQICSFTNRNRPTNSKVFRK